MRSSCFKYEDSNVMITCAAPEKFTCHKMPYRFSLVPKIHENSSSKIFNDSLHPLIAGTSMLASASLLDGFMQQWIACMGSRYEHARISL